jgi:hypothetical protein
MKRRQEAILNKDKVRDLFNKISLDGSYGYDIKNDAKYLKTKIVNKHKCFLAHLTPHFRSATKLGDDLYLVESVANSFECKTCVHVGIATLDIAKFLYLNFIYNFMYKCLDMDRAHLVESDTDSFYWAVAGRGNSGFQDIIKDEEFYMKHIGEYLTSDFYGVSKTFDNPLDKMCFDKRFGGLAIEKQSKNMVALASKLYVIWDDEKEINKAKGVSQKFKRDQYLEVLEQGKIVQGANRTLTMKDGSMSHIHTTKTALTAIYTKMRVLQDGSFCSPLFLDVEDL